LRLAADRSPQRNNIQIRLPLGDLERQRLHDDVIFLSAWAERSIAIAGSARALFTRWVAVQ
jgi:hypothetical protein